MYRAIANQMNDLFAESHSPAGASSSGSGVPAEWKDIGFADLRRRAASYIRSNPSDFAPFLGLEASSVEFDDYCRLVHKNGPLWLPG
jgi:hypothetical protein